MGDMLKHIARSLPKGAALFLALCVVAVGMAIHESAPVSVELTAGDEQGWGSEALAESSTESSLFSIIGVANACGLGASSCFRCHNGTRAEEPNMDAASGPWHAQHTTVNNSCAGCHKGNPRIIRQEMAHRDLVANPLAAPGDTCNSCHSGDWEGLVPAYLTVQQGGN